MDVCDEPIPELIFPHRRVLNHSLARCPYKVWPIKVRMKLTCFSDLEAVRSACSDWNHTSSMYGYRITEEFAYQRISEMEVGQRYALSLPSRSGISSSEHQRRAREPSMTLFWNSLRGLSRQKHRTVRQSNVVVTDTWNMLNGLLLVKWELKLNTLCTLTRST